MEMQLKGVNLFICFAISQIAKKNISVTCAAGTYAGLIFGLLASHEWY